MKEGFRCGKPHPGLQLLVPCCCHGHGHGHRCGTWRVGCLWFFLLTACNEARSLLSSAARCRAFFQQLLAALDFCGAIGVANRNLTPEHILLAEDTERGGAPRLKLAGFAMSKDENSDSLCKTACGSPGYVAPEARPQHFLTKRSPQPKCKCCKQVHAASCLFSKDRSSAGLCRTAIVLDACGSQPISQCDAND